MAIASTFVKLLSFIDRPSRRWGVIALGALLGSNALRFSNEIELTYNEVSLEARTHETLLTLATDIGTIRRITAEAQRSMSDHAGMEYLQIEDGAGDCVFRFAPPVLYLLGHDLLGTLRQGESASFEPTYGDWSKDKFAGKRFVVFEGALDGAWKLTARFAGRGNKQLFLEGDRGTASIHLNDGFIDNDFAVCVDGRCPQIVYSSEPRSTNLRRILGFFVQLIFLGAVVRWILLFFAASREKFAAEETPGGKAPPKGTKASGASAWAPMAVWGIAAAHFGLTLWIGVGILGGIPHVPDSAMYYRQAILLSEGRTHVSPAPFQPAEALASHAAVVRGNSIYYNHNNHFWPALLASGVAFGFSEVLNPLLSACCVLLVYSIALFLTDRRTALLAAALWAVCPLTLLLGSEFMIHTPTQLFLLITLRAWLSFLRKPEVITAVVAGAGSSYAFGLRQLTTVALLAPLVPYTLLYHRRSIFNSKVWWAVAGAAPVLAIWLWDNWLITGDPLLLPLAALHGHNVAVANLPQGLNHVDSMLGYLPSTLLFLPLPMAALAFVLIPLFLDPRPEDWFLLALFVSLLAAHSFAPIHGLHGYGPRFLMEGVFGLWILSARGMVLVHDRLAPFGRRAVQAGLVGVFLWQGWGFATVLPEYHNYNTVDSDLYEQIASLDLTHSIVLISGTHWSYLEIGAKLFDPDFRRSLFLRELPDGSHVQILQRFPEREVYRVRQGRLERYDWRADLVREGEGE